MNDHLASLHNFDGIARLFPLPNVVLFPHVMQPLHIFEPRYRQMTADALAGDRLIALVLLKPGWEADYEGDPPLHTIACLGRIVADQRLPDGRYNILLRGLTRVRLVHEIKNDKLYRSAQVELLVDAGHPAPEDAAELRRQVSQHVLPWFPAKGAQREHLGKLLQSDMPLSALCDILSFALSLPVEEKQRLLEDLDVGHRVETLLTCLQTKEGSQPLAHSERRFPPDFSSN